MKVLELIGKLHREVSGQDLVEYALVPVAVAQIAFAGPANLAGAITSGIGKMNATLQTYF